MTTPSATTKQGASVKLADFPIPKQQITEGDPVARIWIAAQSADRKVRQGVWDCTAGKFDWNFTWDEFALVLEGEATIAGEGGQIFTLRAGDFAHFPLGLKTKWHVPKYIRKTFVIRTPEPLKL